MDIFIASGNAHKIGEFSEMFASAGLDFKVMGANALGGMPECEENGESFAANALIKARALARIAPQKSYVMADDSGIVVDYLNGEPGVRSARYSGVSGKDADSANNAKLLSELSGVPDENRTARFICAIALISPDGRENIFEGKFEGFINRGAKGEGGFGYDPLFYVPEKGMTSAEISASEKNEISHRGKAFKLLFQFLKNER